MYQEVVFFYMEGILLVIEETLQEAAGFLGDDFIIIQMILRYAEASFSRGGATGGCNLC